MLCATVHSRGESYSSGRWNNLAVETSSCPLSVVQVTNFGFFIFMVDMVCQDIGPNDIKPNQKKTEVK